jgi:voltage-gated potassium channel
LAWTHLPVRPPTHRHGIYHRGVTRFVDALRGSHVRLWLAAVLGTVIIGTIGYMILGWSLDDSFYMTGITLTTVGFKEVRELDTIGRIWTVALAVAGVAIIFGSIGIVAEAVLSETVSGRREARRMTDEIGALRGHLILCGYGRVGSTVARELRHAGQRFVVVDINPESLAEAVRDGHLVVTGDATNDEVLKTAGIERARGLVATIDSDAYNVYTTLSAKALNPSLFIVARAAQESAEAKLLQAGASRVVSPYTRAGRQIAELAIRPRVADFIDSALSHGQLAFSLEEIEVAEGGPLVGKTVGALRDEGIFALAVVRGERDYEPNPPTGRVLLAGENLIVSGTADTLRALRATS